MRETTLCYIEKDNQYLMLHRTKKNNNPNKEKWIGVGGKIEAGETPDECLLREVREETGLLLTKYQYRAKLFFYSDVYEDEIIQELIFQVCLMTKMCLKQNLETLY